MGGNRGYQSGNPADRLEPIPAQTARRSARVRQRSAAEAHALRFARRLTQTSFRSKARGNPQDRRQLGGGQVNLRVLAVVAGPGPAGG